MSDIIFINPKQNQLGSFDFLVAKSIPLGIGCLAAYLLGRGYSVEIVDEEVEQLTKEKITCLSDKDNPLIGITCMTPNINRGYELADMIKLAYPESTVVLGGIHPTVLPEEALVRPSVDLVVRGEAEPVIEQIVVSHKKGLGFKNVLSCSYQDSGKIIHNERAPLIDINTLPPIPYHLFDSNIYDMGFIMSSRGCPYNCVFCSQRAINGNIYRYRSTDQVLSELRTLIELYNPSNIVFFDDIFTLHKKRVYDLCQGMIKEGLNKKAEFTMVTRGDCIDDGLLRQLRKANFTGLALGVETASEELMKMIDKKETVADIVKGIKLAKDYGFLVDIVFIYGLPGETRQDRVNSFRLARSLDVAKARFNNATPYPGTGLYRLAKEENNLNIVGNWTNFSPTAVLTSTKAFKWPLPYYPKGSTREDIIMDVIQANMLYFLQPKRLWGLIKNLFDRKGTKWMVLPPKWWLSRRYIKGILSVLFINIGRLFLLLKWMLQGKLLTQYKEDK